MDGKRQRDLIITNPGFPDPFSSGAQQALPPSRIQQDPDLVVPYIVQSSLGLETNPFKLFRLTTNYPYQRGVHLLRGRNINAPIAGVRPDLTVGNVTNIESSAYMSAHPPNDRRWSSTVCKWFFLECKRTSGRRTGRWEIGSRLTWGVNFGPEQQPTGGPQVRMIGIGPGEGASAPSIASGSTKKYRFEMYAQAFNLLNHTNLTGVSGVQTSPFFGQATSAQLPRRFEIGMRFNFYRLGNPAAIMTH